MNERGKKAQVTLFVIIAIVAVALILLVILLTGGFKTQFTQAEIAQVKNYLDDCFKFKTQDGILSIARQGGYNTLPQANINFLEEKTAYYWKDNQTLVPTTTTVASELAAYLDAHASECLKMPSYALTATSCQTQVEVRDKVKVLFECPITIQKGMASTQLKDFTVEIDAPLTKMIDVSAQIVEEYKKTPGILCIECFDEISEKNNITVMGVPINEQVFKPAHIWFILLDEQSTQTNLTWRFVVDV